jgi:hypothetical protein
MDSTHIKKEIKDASNKIYKIMSSPEAQNLGKAGLTALIMGTIGTAIHASHKSHPITHDAAAPPAKEPAYIPNYDNNPLLAFSQSGRGIKGGSISKSLKDTGKSIYDVINSPEAQNLGKAALIGLITAAIAKSGHDLVDKKNKDIAFDDKYSKRAESTISHYKGGTHLLKKADSKKTNMQMAVDEITNSILYLKSLGSKINKKYLAYLIALIIFSVAAHYKFHLTETNELDMWLGNILREEFKREKVEGGGLDDEMNPFYHEHPPESIVASNASFELDSSSKNNGIDDRTAFIKRIIEGMIIAMAAKAVSATIDYAYVKLADMLKKEEKDKTKGKGLNTMHKHITTKVASAKPQLDKMYKKIPDATEDRKKMTKAALAGIAAAIIMTSGAYAAHRHMKSRGDSEALLHTEYNDPLHKYNVRHPSNFEQLI